MPTLSYHGKTCEDAVAVRWLEQPPWFHWPAQPSASGTGRSRPESIESRFQRGAVREGSLHWVRSGLLCCMVVTASAIVEVRKKWMAFLRKL